MNDSDDEIADDEQDVRKTTASETLDSLYAVKCFAKSNQRMLVSYHNWRKI